VYGGGLLELDGARAVGRAVTAWRGGAGCGPAAEPAAEATLPLAALTKAALTKAAARRGRQACVIESTTNRGTCLETAMTFASKESQQPSFGCLAVEGSHASEPLIDQPIEQSTLVFDLALSKRDLDRGGTQAATLQFSTDRTRPELLALGQTLDERSGQGLIVDESGPFEAGDLTFSHDRVDLATLQEVQNFCP